MAQFILLRPGINGPLECNCLQRWSSGGNMVPHRGGGTFGSNLSIIHGQESVELVADHQGVGQGNDSGEVIQVEQEPSVDWWWWWWRCW